MSDLASENRKDVEAQVFYALALLANASPADKTHANQKQAADLLEPLDRAYPQHPGNPVTGVIKMFISCSRPI
jgi:hypothetical protein